MRTEDQQTISAAVCDSLALLAPVYEDLKRKKAVREQLKYLKKAMIELIACEVSMIDEVKS